jgi:cell division protein FtsB
MLKKALTRRRLIMLFILLFAIWMLFLDDFNIFRQMTLSNKIQTMEEQKQYYQNEIKNDSAMIKTLRTNLDSLEKSAREKFLMKKEHEDIFQVIEKE